MGLRVGERFKRAPEECTKEVEEEEVHCNECSKHANQEVCVLLLLFVIKDTFLCVFLQGFKY